jgi:hypothetical protein
MQATFKAQGNYYTAGGGGALPGGAQVPTLSDYLALAITVKDMLDDVTRLTAAVKGLLDEFRS